MRLALSIAGVLVLLAAARPALAQPARAPAPARCDLHILRSPEPARAVIEARMRRELRCETSIAVRIVPTTAGLYLLAHTPSGRTYEMVVPDAETAADLIAAWAQRRDQVMTPEAAPLPPLAPPAIGPPSVEARPAIGPGATASEAPGARPPGSTPGSAPEAVPGAAAPGAKAGQWLSLAVVAGADVGGLRGELDLWAKGGWSAGVAVGYTRMQLVSADGTAALEFGDLRGMVTAGHTLGRGALRLRGQVGLGAMRTDMGGFLDGFGPVSYTGTHPVGELGAHLQVAFGRDRAWALTGGPALTIYGQTFAISNELGMQTAASRTYDVSFVGGLRRRL